MWKAWGEVRANRGAPGVDGITIDEIVRSGVDDFLDQLAARLRAGSYRPRPLRRGVYPEAGQARAVAGARYPLSGRQGGDGGSEDRA